MLKPVEVRAAVQGKTVRGYVVAAMDTYCTNLKTKSLQETPTFHIFLLIVYDEFKIGSVFL